MPDINKNKIYV